MKCQYYGHNRANIQKFGTASISNGTQAAAVTAMLILTRSSHLKTQLISFICWKTPTGMNKSSLLYITSPQNPLGKYLRILIITLYA